MDALTALAETEREQCVTVDIRERSDELPILHTHTPCTINLSGQ